MLIIKIVTYIRNDFVYSSIHHLFILCNIIEQLVIHSARGCVCMGEGHRNVPDLMKLKI